MHADTGAGHIFLCGNRCTEINGGQAAHLRRLAVELSGEYMARAVSELATAYENEAVRVETATPSILHELGVRAVTNIIGLHPVSSPDRVVVQFLLPAKR
jgi:hypothetical protein